MPKLVRVGGPVGRLFSGPRRGRANGALLPAIAWVLAGLVAACGQTALPSGTQLPSPTPAPGLAAAATSDETGLPAVLGGPSPSAVLTPGPFASAASSPVPTRQADDTPTSTPSPDSGTPTSRPGEVGPEEPPTRDLLELARRLRPKVDPPTSIPSQERATYEVGHRETFFVIDPEDGTAHTVDAELELLTEHAYWYVDETLSVSAEALGHAASEFEGNIYPTVTRYVSDFARVGVDDDPRLTILSTTLEGVAGYYGSSDLVPREAHPHSNEREIVYVDGRTLATHPDLYLGVLAHEFQHLVHALVDRGEDVWINEGMSEVIKGVSGYDTSFVDSFLLSPANQLNSWADALGSTAPDYGAATLFVEYLAEHYGGYESLKSLVEQPLDGTHGVDVHLSTYEVSFLDVFKDWVVANYLGAPEGPYGYSDRVYRVRDVDLMSGYGERRGTLPQLSAKYIDVRPDDGDAVLGFQGSPDVAQVATQCHSGSRCWWSNRGDSIDSTLTREFDLSSAMGAQLEFWTWFAIEEGWDYGYVEVSADGGSTWTILEGANTTTENPSGNSYGHGFTGRSDDWVRERIDLSPYVGGKVLVRFEYVTDDGVYLDGLLIDDIAIREIGFCDDAESPSGWQARGFVRTDNSLEQRYFVQVVERHRGGEDIVREMALDESSAGEMVLRGFGSELVNAVVIVAPATPDTQQRAPYTLTVAPAGGGEAQRQ